MSQNVPFSRKIRLKMTLLGWKNDPKLGHFGPSKIGHFWPPKLDPKLDPKIDDFWGQFGVSIWWFKIWHPGICVFNPKLPTICTVFNGRYVAAWSSGFLHFCNIFKKWKNSKKGAFLTQKLNFTKLGTFWPQNYSQFLHFDSFTDKKEGLNFAMIFALIMRSWTREKSVPKWPLFWLGFSQTRSGNAPCPKTHDPKWNYHLYGGYVRNAFFWGQEITHFQWVILTPKTALKTNLLKIPRILTAFLITFKRSFTWISRKWVSKLGANRAQIPRSSQNLGMLGT